MKTKRDANELQAEYQLNWITHTDLYELTKNDSNHILKTMQTLAQNKEGPLAGFFTRLFFAFSDYLINNAMVGETLHFCKICKELAANDPDKLAWASLIAFRAHWALGAWHEAGEEIKEALHSAADHNSHEYAWILFYWGSFQINRGRYNNALSALAESRKLFIQWQDSKGEVTALVEEGTFYLDRYLYEQALDHYSHAAEIEKAAFGEISTHTLMMLGQANYRLRNLEVALTQIEQALNSPPQTYTFNNKGTMLYFKSWILSAQQKYDEALAVADDAQHMYASIQNQRGKIDVLELVGEIEFFKGNYIEAEKNYLSCARARFRVRNLTGFAAISRRIEKLYKAQGKKAKANFYLLLATFFYIITGNFTLKRFKRFFFNRQQTNR